MCGSRVQALKIILICPSFVCNVLVHRQYHSVTAANQTQTRKDAITNEKSPVQE